MSTAEILLLVGAIVPILGNLVALALRRSGRHRAADLVDLATPAAARLGASKSREEAIANAVDLLAVAASELGPEHPVSQAAEGIRKELRPASVPPPGGGQ